ncbi:hypothetical protein [Peribacillus simplex]|uniref:hypothetical protein n=1 Tax=Peribacillus simplex TaxID=1478 RepID=UPI00162A780F|nr:hypothetical protein [Peribacillus simplex]
MAVGNSPVSLAGVGVFPKNQGMQSKEVLASLTKINNKESDSGSLKAFSESLFPVA